MQPWHVRGIVWRPGLQQPGQRELPTRSRPCSPADTERTTLAMVSVDTLLMDRANGLAPLFTPPCNRATVDPGYVSSYPPGIRENGGQYTHAAAWTVIALAQLDQGDRAAGLFRLLNPINKTRTETDTQRYRVEPYAVAADVYAAPPHVGRGGWTWYTGAAGWLYRAGLESILGMRIEGDTLWVNPCIPGAWPGFEVRYRHGETPYVIEVSNPPYIPSGVIGTLEPDVAAFEPGLALDGGTDGLAAYRTIARVLPALLAPGGQEILECFALWNKHHGEKPVRVQDLHDDIRGLLDPQGRGRQFFQKRVQQLDGTRLNGMAMTRQAASGRWGVATYALKATGEAKSHRGHRGHRHEGSPEALRSTPQSRAPGPETPMPPMPLHPANENECEPQEEVTWKTAIGPR